MKRQAILLHYEDSALMTGKDVNDFSMFLQSMSGGAWFEHEIVCRKNIRLQDLNSLLEDTKKRSYDYLILYFSGHGGTERGTFIELNPDGECVQVSCLFNLAVRQLSVFDCCRSYPVNENVSFALDSRDEFIVDSEPDKAVVRKVFDDRVMDTPAQSMVLYACSEGECAHDFGSGGVYTQNLLQICRNFKGSMLLVSQAHAAAHEPTVNEAFKHGMRQHPDFFMVKYPSRYQLPLALNVNSKDS